ncbi:condensation domain-containing protein [Kitasatospora phosalacinea]|uniref:condensation domain-containing protein n=1 Tax=Kitasatospora phosalacinea TaxID=2065 RepID=UPI0035D9016D
MHASRTVRAHDADHAVTHPAAQPAAHAVRLPGEGPGGPLPGPAERVAVAFDGLAAGTEPLTWGQWSLWEAMVRHGSWMPLGGTKALAPGTGLADLAAELRYLVTRYPSMRTRLRFDGGPEPLQEVAGAGEVLLEVHDAPADGDPAATAAAVEAHHRHAPLDAAADWPVRMAVVRHRGAPTHLVVLICHLATDAAGARTMLREVAERSTAPAEGLQPLDQARWQCSPAGQRQDGRALRHHEQLLRSAPLHPLRPPHPAHPLSGPTPPPGPRYWSAELRARALGPAAAAVARRTGATPTTVLLALYAVALARATGVNPVVLRPMVGNRFRPGLADVVCMLSQLGLCSVDLAGTTLDEAVDRTRRAALGAYKHGYYDPRRFADLLDRVSRERGPGLDVSRVFNDRRAESPDDGGAVPAAAGLRAARERSGFRWTDRTDRPSERLFLTVEDHPDGVLLSFTADVHHFPAERVEPLLRDLEGLAVAAAHDPAAPSGVH